MAAVRNACGRLVLQTSNCFSFTRQYSIRPPISLGGRTWRRLKGVPAPEGKSFEEKIAAFEKRDADVEKPINIGEPFTPQQVSPTKFRQAVHENHRKKDFEKKARCQELLVPLEEVWKDWAMEYKPLHVKTVAEHYGIFKDLFNDAFFIPKTQVLVAYDFDEDFITPVLFGNHISPSEAVDAPHVQFESDSDSLWTLLMTNPDGHLKDDNKEYLHWLVANIPGDDVSKGDVICDYLRPFPPKGTGYHRHVFILFKQTERLDLSAEQRPHNCANLRERTFQTVDFYRQYDDQLTAVGLNFFQSDWDPSVRDVYHNILNMMEPSFEYKHPVAYHPPIKTYPHKEPFNKYLDRYRDKKDLAEEVLRLKMSMIKPFSPHEPCPKYPLVHRAQTYKPQWLKKKEELIHRRVEQFKDLP